MEIAILAIGRLKAGPEPELVARYLDRAAKAGRQLGFRGFQVSELPEGRGARALERMSVEAEDIRGWAGSSPFVCLDEDGDLLDSEEFARWLRAEADRGTARMGFAIGGPDGLDPAIAAAASRRLSFGRMTWPHQLARVLLAEQLYRAMTIISGHPYHRA